MRLKFHSRFALRFAIGPTERCGWGLDGWGLWLFAALVAVEVEAVDSSFLEAREARREGEGNNNSNKNKTKKGTQKGVSNEREYPAGGGGGGYTNRQGHPRPQVMIICCAVAMRSEGVQRGN